MNPFQKTLAAALALCIIALLPGCARPFGEVDALGRGGTISQKVIDNEPRPPKQVLFRYDDHRYLENDPTGGYIGGCQGEMYYVDEKLGIRTQYATNTHPLQSMGVFKVEGTAPFIIARDEDTLYISFDQGRKFERLSGVGSGADAAIVNEMFYVSSGANIRLEWAFQGNSLTGISKYKYVEKPGGQDKKLEEISESRTQHYGEAGWMEPHPGLSETALAKAKASEPWAKVRAEIGVIDERHRFKCDRDLPWRPSVNRERENLKPQQKSGAKP